MASKVRSIIATGSRGTLVDIECHLSNNLPNIVIVGLANKAVDESRERIRGSFSTSRIRLPRKRIIINLAPADIPKADSSFDMAIAVAILAASNQLSECINESEAYIGELGLDGSTRAVRGIIGKLLAGRELGTNRFYIPAGNLEQARLVPHISLVAIENLGQLFRHLNGDEPLEILSTGEGSHTPKARPVRYIHTMSEVTGQLQAKRALEIAAAGGHNVFFSGPPGTGKSMLAKALPSILPPLSVEEMLEVSHLHSLAGHDYEKVVNERPFRSPHHSASHVAIVGGGTNLKPGEITLAHRGVLFFDELPEFGRMTLEALRQPLEDRMINLARAKDSVVYPANFIMVATSNPCPCGYYGSDSTCRCLPSELIRYRNRLSGPIMDRIDLYTNVHEIQHKKLLATKHNPQSDKVVADRVQTARQAQSSRFGSLNRLNADMDNAEIKAFSKLTLEAHGLLNDASASLKLSARAYMRTIRVARTIADLEQSESCLPAHVSEALSYRPANIAWQV